SAISSHRGGRTSRKVGRCYVGVSTWSRRTALAHTQMHEQRNALPARRTIRQFGRPRRNRMLANRVDAEAGGFEREAVRLEGPMATSERHLESVSGHEIRVL